MRLGHPVEHGTDIAAHRVEHFLAIPMQQSQTMPDPKADNPSRHAHMLGAALVRHLPGASRRSLSLEQQPQGLFLVWLAYMGLLAFGAGLLWQAGVWHRLIEVDPTRLTLLIVLVFTACSLWCGKRAWDLGSLSATVATTLREQVGHLDSTTRMAILGERLHGPHEMAWWLNGIQLKLGLLGKVIGFSILAYQLGQTESFDPSQSAQLLRSLTGGLGIALLTTVTGLCGNILLGLQLMRLDRYADGLMARVLAHPATPDRS